MFSVLSGFLLGSMWFSWYCWFISFMFISVFIFFINWWLCSFFSWFIIIFFTCCFFCNCCSKIGKGINKNYKTWNGRNYSKLWKTYWNCRRYSDNRRWNFVSPLFFVLLMSYLWYCVLLIVLAAQVVWINQQFY